MHNAHLSVLSLKCVLMSLLMRINQSKIFKVHLKYTCNSSTLEESNILQYIFSGTSALLPHKESALSKKVVVLI